MLIHQGWSTALYTQPLLDSQSFGYTANTNRTDQTQILNYTFKEGSVTGILEQLKWESLKKRRTDNRFILLNKSQKGKAKIPTDDLIPKTRRCRNSHSKTFQLYPLV